MEAGHGRCWVGAANQQEQQPSYAPTVDGSGQGIAFKLCNRA